MNGTVDVKVAQGIATVLINRPQARNAMTWEMYDALVQACETLDADRAVRVIVLRGAGGKAFIAGTDIQQFADFRTAEDGIAYEQRVDAVVQRVATSRTPTIAAVEGWCVGGGLAIAAACDLRIATEDAKFGAPIARTVGNCLSGKNVAALVAMLGASWTQRMLLGGELMGAGEAQRLGFLCEVASASNFDLRLGALAERLLGHAPLTMRAAKEAIRRATAAKVEDEDLIRLCYGSRDFKEGVASYIQKRPPVWAGE